MGGRRILRNAIGLADQYGEAPPWKVAAPALAEHSQPIVGPLAHRPIEILKIAVRVSALVLLESGDSRLHNSEDWHSFAPRASRFDSGGGPVSLGINSVMNPVGAGGGAPSDHAEAERTAGERSRSL